MKLFSFATGISLILMTSGALAQVKSPPGQRGEKPQEKAAASQPAATANGKLAPTPDKLAVFNGKNLDGLTVLNESYFEDHGPVRVDQGQLILGSGTPGTGIRIDPKRQEQVPKIDYEILITARRVEGRDFFCGLTFPINKSYCTLILGGWGGGAIGLSNVDSMSAIENETSEFYEFENGKWYDIHLTVTAKKIRATLKETEAEEGKAQVLFEIDTPDHKYDIWWEQQPARPLGLTTWNTTAAIRRFELRKIK